MSWLGIVGLFDATYQFNTAIHLVLLAFSAIPKSYFKILIFYLPSLYTFY